MDKKTSKIIKILRKFKKKIEKNLSLDSLILFGSRARGDERENSDVDLIIVSKDFEGKKSFKRAVKFYLDWDWDYNTDIICLTPRELENKKNQIGIIQSALNDGIEI